MRKIIRNKKNDKVNKILVLVFLIVVTFCSAQNKFIGKWKVIEIDANSEYYYNIELDSIVVSKKWKETSDSSGLEFILNLLKDEYKNKNYVFSEFEVVEISDGIVLMTSEYKIDDSKNIITIYRDYNKPKAFFEFLSENKLLLNFLLDEKSVKITLKKIK